jgi:hypothetical protein
MPAGPNHRSGKLRRGKAVVPAAFVHVVSKRIARTRIATNMIHAALEAWIPSTAAAKERTASPVQPNPSTTQWAS